MATNTALERLYHNVQAYYLIWTFADIKLYIHITKPTAPKMTASACFYTVCVIFNENMSQVIRMRDIEDQICHHIDICYSQIKQCHFVSTKNCS